MPAPTPPPVPAPEPPEPDPVVDELTFRPSLFRLITTPRAGAEEAQAPPDIEEVAVRFPPRRETLPSRGKPGVGRPEDRSTAAAEDNG